MSILHSKVTKIITNFIGIVYNDINKTWVNLDWTKIPKDFKNDIKVTTDFAEGLCLVLDLDYDNSGKKVGLQFLQVRCNESLSIVCSNKKIQNEGMSKIQITFKALIIGFIFLLKLIYFVGIK